MLVDLRAQDGTGAVFNVSRGIMYAYRDKEFEKFGEVRIRRGGKGICQIVSRRVMGKLQNWQLALEDSQKASIL
jgi:hypothetical protein